MSHLLSDPRRIAAVQAYARRALGRDTFTAEEQRQFDIMATLFTAEELEQMVDRTLAPGACNPFFKSSDGK